MNFQLSACINWSVAVSQSWRKLWLTLLALIHPVPDYSHHAQLVPACLKLWSLALPSQYFHTCFKAAWHCAMMTKCSWSILCSVPMCLHLTHAPHTSLSGVAIETRGFTFVTSGKKRETLTGESWRRKRLLLLIHIATFLFAIVWHTPQLVKFSGGRFCCISHYRFKFPIPTTQERPPFASTISSKTSSSSRGEHGAN